MRIYKNTRRLSPRSVRFGLSLTLLILAAGALFIGCRSDEDRADLSGPALSVEDASAKRTEFNKRNPAGYTPGSVPGIAVTMDFTDYHREGRPYGDWMLHASWRACRKGCPELVSADVRVTIDPAGRGTALIPAGFLNEVVQIAQQKFEEGKGDLGVWWNDRALVLDLLGAAAEGESLDDYFDVDLGEEGYTYALSAGAVAGGLQQILEALGIAWWPGKPGDVPQNVALALAIGKCIGVTETPPAPTTAVSSSGGASCAAWCNK